MVETMMDFKGFMEDLVMRNEIKREGCFYNFVIQSTHALPTNGVEWLTRKIQPIAHDVAKARSIFT